MKIIDSHVHLSPVKDKKGCEFYTSRLLYDCIRTGAEAFNLLVVGTGISGMETSGNSAFPASFFAKESLPERVYLYGGLDYSDIHSRGGGVLADQLDLIMRMGCDGLKLLIGKPGYRKGLNISLTSEILEPLWQSLEKTNFPAIFHINDPAEFWDKTRLPQWAKEEWSYDKSYPTYSEIKNEALALFKKYPNLNLTLAHFFFASGDLDEAAALLDAHPSISLDLAPGIEMYHDFSLDVKKSREFFSTYSDRIIYGTDSGMDYHSTSLNRGRMVVDFLAGDGGIMVPADDPLMMPDKKDTIKALNLDAEVHDKILWRNFYKKAGKPKKADPEGFKELLSLCYSGVLDYIDLD